MNDKKLLAILGSPHTAGTTATMLNCAVHAAEKVGYEVIRLNLYDKQIAYCKGCRACLCSGNCIQQDDMSEIVRLLKECNVGFIYAKVEVTVQEEKIVNIEIIEHRHERGETAAKTWKSSITKSGLLTLIAGSAKAPTPTRNIN